MGTQDFKNFKFSYFYHVLQKLPHVLQEAGLDFKALLGHDITRNYGA